MTLRAAWAWPALILLAAPLSCRADPDATLAECGARNGTPTGLPGLEADCPQLQAALDELQLRPLIIDSSRALLDRHSLRQLQRLSHPAARPAPDVAMLAPILRRLDATVAPPRSWWRRLWEWLVGHLTPQQQGPAPWLNDLVRLAIRVRWLWTAIIWSTLIALPVAVAIVIWREARAMGRRSNDVRVGTRAAETATAAAGGGSRSRLAVLGQAPLVQRPAPLFAMLIGRLVAAGRLPPDRSFTHREVARTALLDDAEQRRLLESLARLAERQLYAQAAGAPEGLAELLAQAEDLYTTGWGRPLDIPK